MKIVMIHPHDIYSHREPWTSRIRNIAKKLIEFGHDVHLIYFVSPENEGKNVSCDDIPTTGLLRKTREIPRNIMTIVRIAQWADVMHVQKCFGYAMLPALLAHVLHNKPIHYDWDDYEHAIYNASQKSRIASIYLGYIERMVARLVDTITVSSRGLYDYARSLGINADRLFQGHVGVDLDLFKPAGATDLIEPPLVVYLGQLHGGQYVRLFLEAVQYVRERKEAQFMIIGSGTEQKDLESYADELGVRKYIQFVGSIPHEDVPIYLAPASIAVACFEDNDITRCKSPLKVVEYMASKKAIVASDVGEVADMLAGCGILTKAGNSKSLAKGIIDLLDNKLKREHLATSARRNAEDRFCWSVTTKNVVKAYKKALTYYDTKIEEIGNAAS